MHLDNWPDTLGPLLRPATSLQRKFWRALILGLILACGFVDYLTGSELSLLVFYFAPVALAVATLGVPSGVAAAILSIVSWLAGDFAAGVHYAYVFVPFWNAAIALVAYGIMIWLVAALLAVHRRLEERVRARTAALTNEIAERERLERELLAVAERERRLIGHDLHDGLCQHLAGTAIVAHVLADRIDPRESVLAAEARRVVALVQEAIRQSRLLAKGMLLPTVEDGDLPAALRELAEQVRTQFRIACVVETTSLPAIIKPEIAIQLYRITQEAVSNAARHGHPRLISVVATGSSNAITLTITDDGTGLPAPAARGQGMGLRVMAHRATMTGGTCVASALPRTGTQVHCLIPLPYA